MLIGLCGPRCSGKREVVQYLVTELGFTCLDTAGEQSGTLKPSQLSPSCSVLPVPPQTPRVTQCWREDVNIVIRDIRADDPALPNLLKRPYFLLTYVDAPMLLRFRRAVSLKRLTEEQLEEFVEEDDTLKFNLIERSNGECGGSYSLTSQNGLSHSIKTINAGDENFTLFDMQRLSRLHIVNRHTTIAKFHAALRTVNFTDTELLRPGWDTYFMSLAKLAAERTNCMKRRVGCVIARNKRMVATGYNGTPSGVQNCSEGGCARCNGAETSQGIGLDLCLCLHAEENAIIEAGRERCEGSTLYTNLFPCVLCSKKIVQSGISRVVFDKHYATDGAAKNLLMAGSVTVEQFARDDSCERLGYHAGTTLRR